MQTKAVRSPARVPVWLKVMYTTFVCVLVPYYWSTYTPWNFLYFCDIALLVTLAALWLESPFLVSTQAVGILLPQALWVVDFAARLLAGVHLTGMTSYMFNADLPLFVRGLSSFHGWLPFVLLWLVVRLRYDRRALGVQSALAVVVLLVSFFLAPPPPPSISRPSAAVNINYVYGMDDTQAQTWMAPEAWLLLMIAFNLLCLYVPTHFLLQRFCSPEPTRRSLPT
jgi:hypothetical protein